MKKKIIGLFIFCSTMYGLFAAYDFYSSYPDNKVQWEEIHKSEKVSVKEWRQFSTLTPGASYRYFAGNPLFPVFDVQYDIDENGLRIEEHLQTETKEHLILGGCSMVFGVALKAEDTLSSVMRSENSSVNTVNFGFPGGGIQNLIRAMDFINIKNYAKEENGTFVYMFLPNHMHRWQPTSQFVSWASPKHVYYEVKDHKLYPKELSDSEAYKNFQIAKMAGLEHSYLKANGIKVFNDSDYGSFAEGIKELRRKYLSLYPKGKFLVSIYPDYIEVAAVDALKAVLLKEKIEFLDFISDFEKYKADKKMNQSQFYVPVDGHHNRAFNEFVATKLGETIFKK